MKKILLLGPHGQLGTDITNYFSKDTQLELILLDRNSLNIQQHSDILPTLQKIDFDIIINTIAYNRVDVAEIKSAETFAVNAQAVKFISQACLQKNAIFIQMSTDYVFNGQKKSPYFENDNIGPLSVYGSSKAMGEQLSLLINPKTYILRVASLFGVAGSSGKGGNFVETMIKFGKEKGVLNVVNDTIMSPTSTAWIAKAIHQIINKKPEYGIYHTVNSGAATWYEFTCKIIQKTKINAQVNPVTNSEFPTLALRPTYSVLDNSKLKSVIVEIPSWEAELEQYLNAKGHI